MLPVIIIWGVTFLEPPPPKTGTNAYFDKTLFKIKYINKLNFKLSLKHYPNKTECKPVYCTATYCCVSLTLHPRSKLIHYIVLNYEMI